MTFQLKQTPLIFILIGLIFGVWLLQQPRKSDSDRGAGRTVPPAPKPRPAAPRSEPMAKARYTPGVGVSWGTEEVIETMNKQARDAGQRAYEDVVSKQTPIDRRPLNERVKQPASHL